MRRRYAYQTAVVFYMLVLFLAGTAVPELFRMGTGTYTGFCSMYSFSLYERMEIRIWDLFEYILKIRILTFLFLWLSAQTVIGTAVHVLYAGWLSLSAGMLLALFTLRNGKEGVLLLGCCLLPQWILYLAAFGQEWEVLLEGRLKEIRVWNGNLLTGTKREWIQLGKILLWCTAGCACEAFLGTWTLKIFLQISA